MHIQNQGIGELHQRTEEKNEQHYEDQKVCAENRTNQKECKWQSWEHYLDGQKSGNLYGQDHSWRR